jgi:hypothetical protein
MYCRVWYNNSVCYSTNMPFKLQNRHGILQIQYTTVKRTEMVGVAVVVCVSVAVPNSIVGLLPYLYL